MLKYRNNGIKPLLISLYSCISLLIILGAVFLGRYLLTWELEGVIYTFCLACIAIPIHIIAKNHEPLYVVSLIMNSVGIGLGISSYYAHGKIPLDIIQMVFSLLAVMLLIAVMCLLLYRFKDSKKLILIVFGVIAAILTVLSIVFWVINGAIFFSFGFFCLIEALVWVYVCALTVNVNKRHILRDISFGGFGIAILVGVTVLSLVTEDDCGLEVFGEEIGEALTLNKNKKRRK